MSIDHDLYHPYIGQCRPDSEFLCDGRCMPVSYGLLCNGKQECIDGADERNCPGFQDVHPVPQNLDVATSIVLPTIFACIFLVAAMLVGIKKCKQWELDRVVEMRRTRRVVQRLTARLREKNLRTLAKAKDLRKRALAVQKARLTEEGYSSRCTEATSVVITSEQASTSSGAPPPDYQLSGQPFVSGNSPPPSYEDALLDEFFQELLPREERGSVSSRASRSRLRSEPRRSTSLNFFRVSSR